MKKIRLSKSTWAFITSIILFIAGVINISVNALSILNNPATTSFPWYSAIFFTGIHYVLPILTFSGLGIYFAIKQKNSKNK